MAEPSKANIDKMWAYARKYAEKSGTALHPDVSVTEAVVQGLAKHIEEVGRPLCPCNFYPAPRAPADHRVPARGPRGPARLRRRHGPDARQGPRHRQGARAAAGGGHM